MRAWQEEKDRIAQGLADPFDLPGLERVCEARDRKAKLRKEKRRRKRAALGFFAPSDTVIIEGDGSEKDIFLKQSDDDDTDDDEPIVLRRQRRTTTNLDNPVSRKSSNDRPVGRSPIINDEEDGPNVPRSQRRRLVRPKKPDAGKPDSGIRHEDAADKDDEDDEPLILRRRRQIAAGPPEANGHRPATKETDKRATDGEDDEPVNPNSKRHSLFSAGDDASDHSSDDSMMKEIREKALRARWLRHATKRAQEASEGVGSNDSPNAHKPTQRTNTGTLVEVSTSRKPADRPAGGDKGSRELPSDKIISTTAASKVVSGAAAPTGMFASQELFWRCTFFI